MVNNILRWTFKYLLMYGYCDSPMKTYFILLQQLYFIVFHYLIKKQPPLMGDHRRSYSCGQIH